jgi:hypothetical protein
LLLDGRCFFGCARFTHACTTNLLLRASHNAPHNHSIALLLCAALQPRNSRHRAPAAGGPAPAAAGPAPPTTNLLPSPTLRVPLSPAKCFCTTCPGMSAT